MINKSTCCWSVSLLAKWRKTLSTRRGSVGKKPTLDSSSPWPISIQTSKTYDLLYDDTKEHINTLDDESGTARQRTRPLSASTVIAREPLHVLTIPSWCRSPSSTRYTSMLAYVIFTVFMIAVPTAAIPQNHRAIHSLTGRQAIPDRFGNTGNGPAPVATQSLPRILTPTETSTISPSTAIPATIGTSTVDSSSFSTSSAPSYTTTTTIITAVVTPSPPLPTPAPNGSLGEQVQPTTSISPLTPGIIASIATASVLILACMIGIIYSLHRRRRRLHVQEIPIRRSMLVSWLAYRMFGSHREASRSGSVASKYTTRSQASRCSPGDRTKQSEGPIIALSAGTRSKFGSVIAWVDKSIIGRPRPAYVETSSMFLELPRPLFADKETHMDSRKPKRPEADAAPLGRLSGLGFGFGLGMVRLSGLR